MEEPLSEPVLDCLLTGIAWVLGRSSKDFEDELVKFYSREELDKMLQSQGITPEDIHEWNIYNEDPKILQNKDLTRGEWELKGHDWYGNLERKFSEQNFSDKQLAISFDRVAMKHKVGHTYKASMD